MGTDKKQERMTDLLLLRTVYFFKLLCFVDKQVKILGSQSVVRRCCR